MSKDIAEKRLEEHNDVFADIFNNLLFEGKKILKEDELISLPSASYVREVDGKIHEKNRDIRKVDKNKNMYRLVYGLENQTDVDNTMPERVMGYDYAVYEAQIKEIMNENKRKKNPAYSKRIHDDQKIAPSVTVVLYWGEKWEGPRKLHDMLGFPDDTEDILRTLVPDYTVNLIEIGQIPEATRDRLTSDFRFVAECAACRRQTGNLRKLISDRKYMIKHPEEVLDTLAEVLSDVRFMKAKEMLIEREEEGITMCEALDQLMEEKKEQGIQQGIQRAVSLLVKAGTLRLEDAAAFLGISVEEVKENISSIEDVA